MVWTEERLGKIKAATLLHMLVQVIQVPGVVEAPPHMVLRPMVIQGQLDGKDD